MKIYYYKDPRGNFGDDLNEWLWERLLPGRWDGGDDIRFSAIGTLIGPAMPPARRWIVFSSGAGYGPPPAGFLGNGWTISCVRGPLTCHVLAIDGRNAVTDGAALIGALPEFAPLPEDRRCGTVFMPHHNALRVGAWPEACERAGIEFLDPRQDSHTTVARIRRAKLVIADAMHAAIVADSLRVPWVPVMTSPEISTFKWLDWSMSLGLQYDPIPLPSSSTLEAVRSATLPLYGYRFSLPEKTAEAAIAHYRRDRLMKSQRAWPLRRNFGHGAYSRLLAPVVRSNSLANWRSRDDERRVEMAALALRIAASRDGFLSEDGVLHSKQDELLSRLYAISFASARHRPSPRPFPEVQPEQRISIAI
jgi:succinoglycan biosynthesis protein ExoV